MFKECVSLRPSLIFYSKNAEQRLSIELTDWTELLIIFSLTTMDTTQKNRAKKSIYGREKL